MQKKVIVEKMKDQLQKLDHLLKEFSAAENHTVAEIEQVLKETEQLSRVLSAYRFIAEHKEISNDINVHMKIMDVVSKQEETKIELKEQAKPIEPAVKPVEKVEEKVIVEEKKTVPESAEIKRTEDAIETPKSNSALKKIEFGLNDKYRIINELFHQNQAEFTTAIGQLNMTHSWEDAQNYLDSLKGLYNWKSDAPLVKTLYTICQKRFQ
ncbi:MAG TPA: hypothetical protein VGF30_11830 [Bacteroidia bacterium]